MLAVVVEQVHQGAPSQAHQIGPLWAWKTRLLPSPTMTSTWLQVRAGDVLLELDGESLQQMSLPQLVARIDASEHARFRFGESGPGPAQQPRAAGALPLHTCTAAIAGSTNPPISLLSSTSSLHTHIPAVMHPTDTRTRTSVAPQAMVVHLAMQCLGNLGIPFRVVDFEAHATVVNPPQHTARQPRPRDMCAEGDMV